MAKTKISEFSSTPANNTDIDSINIAEGCAPSNINDAIRELMAQLKDFQTGAVGDSFNGPIGSSTASTGAFTNITASGTLGVTGVATLGAGAILNTPASVTLTNATGLPISTGVSGLGTGVATALAVNVGSAGAPVVNGGALGTPSSGTVTNLTGTASININGTVGATTATTGAFTTLSASSTVTLSGGTANGVTYLNGSKVLTSGSALTFDGTNFATTGNISAGTNKSISLNASSTTDVTRLKWNYDGTTYAWIERVNNSGDMAFGVQSSEGMRLTSTGLGIGTSSPATRLQVTTGATGVQALFSHTSGTPTIAVGNSTTTYNTQIGYNVSSEYGYIQAVAAAGVYDDIAINPLGGNVGIGTSSPISGSGLTVAGATYPAITIASLQNNSSWTQNQEYGKLAFYSSDSTGLGAGETAKISVIADTSSTTYPAGALAFFTSNRGVSTTITERMRLDSAGNLGVGTTSPSSYGKLAVSGGNVHVVGQNYTTDAGGGFWASGASTYTVGWYESSGNMLFRTAGTERARIDSSGNLLVGTTNTNPIGSNIPGFVVSSSGNISASRNGGASLDLNRYTSDGSIARFNRSSVQVGSIDVTTTATTYSTSSDYRLKNSIAPMTGALAKVARLKPCTYKWKADGSDGEGFIAHELAEVVPQCVTGEKDAVDEEGNPKYQGIDTSFLVATVVAALQELKAEFDAYKASHP